MSSVNYYKIFCTTDNKFEYVWSMEDPTYCPVNNTHTVDLNSLSIETKISTSSVKLIEEDTPTGEHYMCESYVLTAATGANSITTHNLSWPFPVSVLQLQMNTDTDNLGDIITTSVAPGAVVGYLIDDVSPGATGIYVSSTALNWLAIGYHIDITDGVNFDDCGRVIEVNKATSRILVETSPTNSYLSTSPTYVKMTIYVINNYTIGLAGFYVIGSGKVGSSSVPANTTVKITYQNVDGLPKNVSYQLEFLY